MKIIKADQKELEYWCTLDWDPLMSYLEKKYGVLYKNEIKKRFVNGLKEEQRKRADKEKRKWDVKFVKYLIRIQEDIRYG